MTAPGEGAHDRTSRPEQPFSLAAAIGASVAAQDMLELAQSVSELDDPTGVQATQQAVWSEFVHDEVPRREVIWGSLLAVLDATPIPQPGGGIGFQYEFERNQLDSTGSRVVAPVTVRLTVTDFPDLNAYYGLYAARRYMFNQRDEWQECPRELLGVQRIGRFFPRIPEEQLKAAIEKQYKELLQEANTVRASVYTRGYTHDPIWDLALQRSSHNRMPAAGSFLHPGSVDDVMLRVGREDGQADQPKLLALLRREVLGRIDRFNYLSGRVPKLETRSGIYDALEQIVQLIRSDS